MTPEEIKALRKSLGLTLEKMAMRLKVTYSTFCRWEKGLAKPSPLAQDKLNSLLKATRKK